MKSLEKHNQERQKLYDEISRLNHPHTNGIECPKCGKELWDSDPGTMLASNPPQKDIHCPACGYKGYRLA